MFTTQPNYEVYEYSCHEGNGAVAGGLSGERAYEQQVAEAKAKGLPIPTRSERQSRSIVPPKKGPRYSTSTLANSRKTRLLFIL